MHFVYIDDSGDEKTRCFAGLVVPAAVWKSTLQKIVNHRRALKASDGMLVTVELHATELVGGRGRIAPKIIYKARRAEIFRETLKMLAGLPELRLFNAIGPRYAEKMLVERLVTRINNTMKAWQSQAVIVHDQGKDYTNLVRKMSVYNPVASKYGAWGDGKQYRNFPTDYILEDIFFRDSKRSQFIQMSDLCAYALFRSEFPLASKQKLGINDAFTELEPLCIKEAFGTDRRKLGIIRV
jgi:hypothetical protein